MVWLEEQIRVLGGALLQQSVPSLEALLQAPPPEGASSTRPYDLIVNCRWGGCGVSGPGRAPGLGQQPETRRHELPPLAVVLI
jgi:hypothetical protein